MSSPAWWNQVVEEVSGFQRDNPANLPGAVFAGETRDDGPLIASVGGWSADTVCEIGTMTKAFTATAVLLALEEHGLLDIETPAWRLPGMETYVDGSLKQEIRVRHLLQHTSGLPNVQRYTASPKTPCNDPDGPPPGCADESLNLGPTTPWTCFPGGTNEYIFADGCCRPARLLTLDQVSRYIMQTYSPLLSPGAQYGYSPINYVVAARIVEALSGKSLNIFLKERLFQPLSMSDSFFVAQKTGHVSTDERIDEGVTESQRTRIADITLITRDGSMPPEMAPGPDGCWDKYRRGWRFVFPDGGMYTTAANLLSFLRMLRDGGCLGGRRILSPQIVRLLIGDHGFGHTMGFGYRREATPYGQGPSTVEHLGSKMTYCWLDPRPERPLLGVFLSQRLPNIVVNSNMSAGLKVIFRVFVPAVTSGVYGANPPVAR